MRNYSRNSFLLIIMIVTGKALDQNFVFASLDNAEKKVLASAMEKQLIRERENIITQGEYMANKIISCSANT